MTRLALATAVLLALVAAAYVALDRYLEPTIERQIRERIMGVLVEQGAIPGGTIELFCPLQGCDE